ncbi:UDP-glucosyltransferase 2-like [Leptopilina boulardi]|uniref:UDP-glucosyltransferase 2-like n=1 Tax=Leptopilina boulardi TaxID=63433 RepID=UPI0021F6326E|nr:UDP-glucosyltransferase 2-like [Leptopilina boulardi]
MGYILTIITIVTLVIINNSEISDGYRILGLFPLNGKSHFVMCEQLMKTLAKKGHQVDVVSHFPLKKPFSNYRDFSLKGSIPNVVNNLTFQQFNQFTQGSFKHFVDITGNEICKLLNHPVINNIIKNPPNDPPYDLVIVEVFAAHCYFAFGRHLKVPMIGVSTAALYDWISEPIGNPANQAIIPGAFSGLNFKMNFWQRLKNTLMSHIIKNGFNYYVSEQSKFVDQYFGPGYPGIYQLSKEFALLLVNSHYSINGIQPLTQAVVEVGGLHIEDSGIKLDTDLQQWLDESTKGCIYISFGSMVKIESFPIETLKAFYSTFRNIAPVRVLMKIANPKELPPDLPKNVMIHSWLPQIQILKHKNVQAFVTHGGLMSSLEAIYCGVPMIGIPLFGDQIINIKSLQERKIATSLNYKNITESEFTNTVKTVLKNTEFRENVKKLSKLYYDRPLSPQDTAIFWVEYIIRHGNVLRSPAIDLSWYQVQLLDIYGFIFLVIILVIYLLILIIRGLIKCVFGTKKRNNKEILSKKKK